MYGADDYDVLDWNDHFDAEVESHAAPEPTPVLTTEEVEANGYEIGRSSAWNVADGRPPILPLNRYGDQHVYMRPDPRAFLRGYGRGYRENIARFRAHAAEQRETFRRWKLDYAAP